MQPNQENNVPNRPVVTRRPVSMGARPAGSAAARTPEDVGPTFDNGPSVVGGKSNRKTGWVLAIILLLLIAAGGIGFGVWAWMDGSNTRNSLNAQIDVLQQQNSELQKNISSNEEIMNEGVNISLLQNLIEPYLGSFHYGNNIFDYDFSDDVKVELAFQNLSPSDILEENESDFSYRVPFDILNEKYKELFGGGSEIEKKDYAVGELGDKFYYSEGGFQVVTQPGGGTGESMISVVKNGYYSGSDIIVEVYHDMIAWCDVTNEKYCLESWPIDNDSLMSLIGEFGNDVPVYRMAFAANDGHYVLTSVEKE